MNIPDRIVEQSASESFGPDWDNAHPEDQRHHRNEVRKILNAAAPFIAAQALRDYAGGMDKWFGEEEVTTTGDVTADLRENADRLDPQ